LLTTFSFPIAAQEASEEAKASQYTPQEQAIFSAVERIAKQRSAMEELDKSYVNAEGEAKESILLQRLDRYRAITAELAEFSGLTQAYRDEGGDPKALLIEYRDRLLSSGRRLRQHIDEYRTRMREQTANRVTTTQAGLQGYINDSRLLDMGYQVLAEYVEVVENVGYSAGPSRDYLVRNLPRRIEALAGQIRLNAEREAQLKKALSARKDDAELQEKLRLTAEKVSFDTDSMRDLLAVAENHNLDVSNYQKLLVKTTGELSTEMLDMNILAELFYEWWIQAKQDAARNLGNFILKTILFLFILAIFKGLAALTRKIIKRSISSASVRLSVLMQEMLLSMVSRIIMLLGFLVALAQIGVSLGPVLAGLGVVGFVIGFALQDTLGNFASGVMILIYRPYDVDDFVEAGGVFGKVRSMNIVSTTILTIDNQTLIIPNSKIWGDVIKNVTAQRVRRVDMTFGIGYGDDIPHTEAVLKDILDKHEKVLSTPEPVIKLHNLGDSSMDFVVRPWVKTEDYWEVYWDVTREVKMRFDAEGISIPFPQRDVHLYRALSKGKVNNDDKNDASEQRQSEVAE